MSVVYSTDRLSRDGLHLLLLVDEIEKAGASLIFISEPHQSTPEGQLLTFVRGWASKLEALKIKERTVRGLKERCRQGRLPGRGDLYGYLYVKGEGEGEGEGEGRGIRIPDSDKASVVVNIFTWYAQEGLSLEKLRKRLYALGIASPGGKPYWPVPTLLKLLRNRAYIGKTATWWGTGGSKEEIPVPGATPALVSRELFEAALERLIRNKEFARRRGKHDYPLRGVVFCGKCGRRMVGTSRRSYRRYRCPHCGLVVIADKLEAGVWEKVLSMLSSPGLIRAEVEKTQGNAQGVGLEARLARVEARLRAL